MIFRIIWVGKTKDKRWLALQEEYLRRLSHFVRVEIDEVRESSSQGGKETEGKRILEKLNQSSFVCVLDVTGKPMSSTELSAVIGNWQVRGVKEVALVIGGAEGITNAVADRADLMLSLSFMTFTHEMSRVILLEQLYRAFTIIRGFPYQK